MSEESVLLERVKKLEEVCDRARVFLDDVMPQAHSLCIQDLGNLNDLLILISLLDKQGDSDD